MRALLLICLIGSAVVVLAITPANAKLFYCKDGSGKTVIRDMQCDGAQVTEHVPQPRADPFGDPVAAYNEGDDAQAIRLFRPMAEKGHAIAQSNLGAMYYWGRGVAQDYREAVKWFRLAAAQGNAEAQLWLGLMYAYGYGITQDYQEAAKWFRLAAAQGHALAQSNLNALYEKAKDGRDPLATSTPTPPAAPEMVTNQPGLDPFAPRQTASQRGSYLDRAAMGGISGAVIGALVGLFILVRALVKKFKAPAAAGAMAIYRDRPEAIKIGAALLLGCAAFLVYFLFFKTNTVDYYLNNYQGRLEKLQECGQVPDMTKDRECMNAYTAQRIFMQR